MGSTYISLSLSVSKVLVKRRTLDEGSDWDKEDRPDTDNPVVAAVRALVVLRALTLLLRLDVNVMVSSVRESRDRWAPSETDREDRRWPLLLW